MSAAVRGLRTAAIERLKSEATAVDGRVYTPPVDQTAALPYLVIGSYAERSSDHYGVPGSRSGFDIRAVVRLAHGDAPLLEIWEQVHAALQDRPLAVPGHGVYSGELRYVADYAEPTDTSVRHFVARYEALTSVLP